MLDAFYLNTEDLSYFPIYQSSQPALSIDQLLNYRSQQRLLRLTYTQLTSSPVIKSTEIRASNEKVYDNVSQNLNQFNNVIFSRQQPLQKQADNAKSTRSLTEQKQSEKIFAMSAKKSEENFRPFTSFSPGVVPAGNMYWKIFDQESDLQKIYSQRQYTEIAMNILNSLKGTNSLKKSKQPKWVNRGGSLQARKNSISHTSRQGNNNNLGVFLPEYGSRFGIIEQGKKSLHEKFLNNSEFDPYHNFKRFTDKKSKSKNSQTQRHGNKQKVQLKEKEFYSELEQKYQQLKNESENQWNQSFGQHLKKSQKPSDDKNINKLVKMYQSKNMKTTEEGGNDETKNYFTRRMPQASTNTSDQYQTSFEKQAIMAVSRNNKINKYESFQQQNHNKQLSGNMSSRKNTIDHSDVMPEIPKTNSMVRKNLKNQQRSRQRLEPYQTSINAANKQLSALNEAINKNKFS